jgi:bifunctional non-homologous end joining protein LigD
MDPIIPVARKDPFDHPEWLFELKLDGFRGIADGRRMLSKNGNRLARFDRLLAELPRDLVLDGEIIAADDEGRPRFTALMFGHRPAEYVVFDVLKSEGRDLRGLPLWRRKMTLSRVAREHGLIPIDSIASQGRALFAAVCERDLEGIVAKRRGDPYGPGVTWFKIRNPSYSQKEGRGELFERRQSRRRRRWPVERIEITDLARL